MTTRERIVLVVGALVVAAGLYLAGRSAGKAAAAAQQAEQNARAFLEGAKPARELAQRLKASQDSASAAARAHRANMRRLEATADSAEGVADSIRKARAAELAAAGIPDQAHLDSALTVFPAWVAMVVHSLQAEIGSLRFTGDSLRGALGEAKGAARDDSLAFVKASQRADNAEGRLETAGQRITDLLRTRDCRIPIVGWPCPSRALTFFLGAAVAGGLHLAFAGN